MGTYQYKRRYCSSRVQPAAYVIMPRATRGFVARSQTHVGRPHTNTRDCHCCLPHCLPASAVDAQLGQEGAIYNTCRRRHRRARPALLHRSSTAPQQQMIGPASLLQHRRGAAISHSSMRALFKRTMTHMPVLQGHMLWLSWAI